MRNTNNFVHINLTISKTQFKFLEKAMKEEKIPNRSEFIRRIIDQYAGDLINLYEKMELF